MKRFRTPFFLGFSGFLLIGLVVVACIGRLISWLDSFLKHP